MGLETQDFKWDPRPKTWDPSESQDPGPESQNHKSGTEDLGPLLYLWLENQDLEVNPRTQDLYHR